MPTYGIAHLWAELEQAFKARPAADWVALLGAESIPVAVVNSLAQIPAFQTKGAFDPQLYLRALQAVGFAITAIRDVTPIPHNGCRPPKRRRV